MKNKLYKKIIYALARIKVKQMQRVKDKNALSIKKDIDKDTSSDAKLNSIELNGTDDLEVIDLDVKLDSAESKDVVEDVPTPDDMTDDMPHELTSEERLDKLLKDVLG